MKLISKFNKLNKIWIGKDSRFYNKSIKTWLEKNDIKVYSAHNEGRSAVAERFTSTLKDKVFEYMTSVVI